MADFCRQCHNHHGFPPPGDDMVCDTDLGDIPPPQHQGNDEGIAQLCEGCGPCVVDYIGQCLGSCSGEHSRNTIERYYLNFQEAQEFLAQEKV